MNDEEPCYHEGVVARDEDGTGRAYWICTTCDQEVRPGDEEDEWLTVE